MDQFVHTGFLFVRLTNRTDQRTYHQRKTKLVLWHLATIVRKYVKGLSFHILLEVFVDFFGGKGLWADGVFEVEIAYLGTIQAGEVSTSAQSFSDIFG